MLDDTYAAEIQLGGLEVQPWTVLTIIWIAIAVAVVIALVKAWPLITGFVEAVNAIKDLPDFMATAKAESQTQNDQIAEITDLVKRIRHQTENDHDTNLRDEITEALEGIHRLEAWTGRHEVISDKHRAQLAELQKWADQMQELLDENEVKA